MATLSGTKIADTFDSILHVEDNTAGLVATSSDSRVIQDGVGANSALALATDSVRITSTNKLYFNDVGDEYISGDGTDLTIAAGTALNITADVIDLSDATKDITLNAAVDALNFDSNTLSIDASNNRVGIGTAAPTTALDIYLSDGGSSAGPELSITRHSASAADGDGLGVIRFKGYNDNGTPQLVAYGFIHGSISAKADGSEIGSIHIGGMGGAGTAGASSTTMTIGNNKVGIGTALPTGTLEVADTNDEPEIILTRIDSSITDGNVIGNIQWRMVDADESTDSDICAQIRVNADETHDTTDFGSEMIFYTSDIDSSSLNPALYINNVGYVGIGAAPSFMLDVYEATASGYAARIINDGGLANRYGMTIWCGKDAPDTDGDCRWITLEGGAGADLAHIQYDHSATSAEIVAESDKRLKENIKDTSIDGLDAINSLKFREFNWTENSKRGQTTIPIGLIAQEVESAGDKCSIVKTFAEDQELKDGTKIEDVKGVGYNGIILYLAKAIQELTAKVEALENA